MRAFFFNMVNADSEMTDAVLLSGQNTEGVAVVESSLKELKNALYARCANQAAEKLFDQNDLFEFGIVPNNDLGQLLLCVKQLTQDGLFKVQKKNEIACWKVVKKEDAAKYDVSPPPTPPFAHPDTVDTNRSTQMRLWYSPTLRLPGEMAYGLNYFEYAPIYT